MQSSITTLINNKEKELNYKYTDRSKIINELSKYETSLIKDIQEMSSTILHNLQISPDYGYVNRVLQILQQLSPNSYMVGGCVRDLLLGLPVNDFDFVTDTSYERLIETFTNSGYKVKETGKQFKCLKVTANNITFDIANFRKDGTYTDGRRPDSVSIGNIQDDAERRDFTINALYFNYNELVFPIKESLSDIQNKLLRFIGTPEDRIHEDFLRVIRFYRFVKTKGLRPDKKSLKACRNNFNLLLISEKDRVRDELEKVCLS